MHNCVELIKLKEREWLFTDYSRYDRRVLFLEIEIVACDLRVFFYQLLCQRFPCVETRR